MAVPLTVLSALRLALLTPPGILGIGKANAHAVGINPQHGAAVELVTSPRPAAVTGVGGSVERRRWRWSSSRRAGTWPAC